MRQVAENRPGMQNTLISYAYKECVVGMADEFDMLIVCRNQRFHFQTSIVAKIDQFFFQQTQIHTTVGLGILVYELQNVNEARIVA